MSLRLKDAEAASYGFELDHGNQLDLRAGARCRTVGVPRVFAGGCAHWPATPRLEQAGAPGYRLAEVTRPGQSDDLLVVLAMSGGGTRAAALGYGVLEELRRTEVTVNGVKRRLLDEVDVISAVSGGTLPATYYALRGEKTFEEFEAKVLSRNFEIELAKRIILNPVNWFRLPSGTFGKSDLFAELYDETVFDHATFADLKRANGPLRDHQRHRYHHRRPVQLHAGPVRRHLRRSLEGDAGTGRCHLDGAAAAAHADHLREPRRDLRQEGAGLAGRCRGRCRRDPRRRAARCFAPARSSPTRIRPARTSTSSTAVSPRISAWPRWSGPSRS